MQWWSFGPWDKAAKAQLGEGVPAVLFRRGKSRLCLRLADLDFLAPFLRLQGGLTPAGEMKLRQLIAEEEPA